LKNAASGLAATGLAAVALPTEAMGVKLTGGLIHHVFFWLKEPGNSNQRKQFEQAVADLLKVETIKMSHFGVPASTEARDVVDNSYTYSYMVIFGDQKGHDDYQAHPLHDQFKTRINDLVTKVVVYDSVD